MGAWQDYLEQHRNEILDHPRGRDLMMAMVDGRRWEEPVYYDKMNRKLAGIDAAKAKVDSLEAGGYWFRVALRALIMLDMSPEERQALVDEARAAHEEADRLLMAEIKASTGERIDPASLEERKKKTAAVKDLLGSIKI